MALLDVLAELRERIEPEFQKDYPLAELLMVISAFLVSILDTLIQRCFNNSSSTRSETSDFDMDNDREENDSEEGAVLIRGSEKPTKRSSVTDRRKRNGGKVTKIIIGLFLHSILTGISVGMVSSKADLMAGIIALLPHKIAVLLLLSTMLLEIKSYSRLLHIIAFSSALPLGIIISGLVTASVHSPWILISLEALGSGAVFYVSCFEMLPEAFQGDWKILKCIFTIIGVSIIAILQIFHSDEHDGH